MPAGLEQIVAATRQRLQLVKESADRGQLAERAARHEPRGFRRSLEQSENSVAVIAELKQASPSLGLIRESMHVAEIALQYEKAGAAALSVLTEEQYFRGSLANLNEASAASRLPCLRKDFIIDELQLLEARANRADAVLLIASVLDGTTLRRFYVQARQLGLDVLCEVHNEEELARALDAGCDIIGVNSRNLRTFKVDIETALRMSEHIPAHVLRVAESGIHSGNDIARLRAAGYQAFLVGELFMKADQPGQALETLRKDALRAGFASSAPVTSS